MISFVGNLHPYQVYIRTRQVRFTGVHQIPTTSKRSDFHEKYLAAQPQLEGGSQVLEAGLVIFLIFIKKIKKIDFFDYNRFFFYYNQDFDFFYQGGF